MKAWKQSGNFLMATGVIHNTVGLIMGWDTLKGIASDGFINTINTEMDRNAIFWFLFTGFLLMITGGYYQDQIKQTSRALPARQGYYLLILSVIGCLMMPVSGFWIVVPQAMIIIIANSRASVAPAVR
jgi:hypothetical protein